MVHSSSQVTQVQGAGQRSHRYKGRTDTTEHFCPSRVPLKWSCCEVVCLAPLCFGVSGFSVELGLEQSSRSGRGPMRVLMRLALMSSGASFILWLRRLGGGDGLCEHEDLCSTTPPTACSTASVSLVSLNK